MIEKKVTCTVCPVGCEILVMGEDKEILSLRGHACKRGEEYARNEYLHPVRILTSTIRVEGAGVPLVPVRSDQPVPQELLFECMEQIKKAGAAAPVFRYDVLVRDICGTGVNIVATGEAERRE